MRRPHQRSDDLIRCSIGLIRCSIGDVDVCHARGEPGDMPRAAMVWFGPAEPIPRQRPVVTALAQRILTEDAREPVPRYPGKPILP